jgi:hypothetical protein
MKQHEQVVEAMRRNGGYATFKQLNELVDFSSWKTKTPQASVRGIVQRYPKIFFKIQPGLWALSESRDDVLNKFQIKQGKKAEEEFTHSYFQGVLVEIGNMRRFNTYVPSQDKNKLFLETPLIDITTVNGIYDFTYPEILKRAKTVDVIWFNERRLPHSFFEVEHSTDIRNSLSKFYELQDYFAKFFIIAPKYRERQFSDVIAQSMYKPLKDRVDFVDYDKIVSQYSKMSELQAIESPIRLVFVLRNDINI